MNVLIVADVLGKENNGTTIAAMNLTKYLKSQGETVKILCADQDRKNDPDFFVVPNLYLGFFLNRILVHNNVTLSKPNTKIIKKALENVDIVHVMIAFPLGNKTTKIARKMGIPVTAGFHCQAQNFTSHVGLMHCQPANKLLYKIYYHNLYRKINAVHYPTKFIQDEFESSVKRKTNGYVISNGVNKSFVPIKIEKRDDGFDKCFNILFIGRLSKEKTHKILVKAVSLSKHKENIQLIFAGQGPREKEILNLSKKLKINIPKINFYSRTDLIRVINQCDLYVHPSEAEIEAISCLEAISCGLVPIISDSPYSATGKFALDERNIFNHKSAQDLANKIDYWIENPDEKAVMSKKYEGFARDFDSGNCMKQMHAMLKTYAKDINHTSKKTFYYRDPLNDDFANNGIKKAEIKSNFRYYHTNPFFRFFQFIAYYIIAKPIVFCLNKIVYRQKIVNNLTVSKKSIRGGFIYANHTNSMGDAFTPNLIFARRNNIITGPEVMSLKGLRTFITMLGAYPLPSTIKGTSKFLSGIKSKIKDGEFITIYPEAHIWPFYTEIRDFKDSSFRYPIDLNAPSICITNTYQKKGKRVRLVSYIDGPFYPNVDIPRAQAKKELRDIIYETMKNRAKEANQYEKNKYIDLNEIEEKA